MVLNWLAIGVQSLLTTVSVLVATLIVLKLLKPRIKRVINDSIHLAEARLTQAAPKIMQEMVKDIDVGDIMGKLGGESGSGGLEGILGSLSGGSKGGLGDLLKLLSSFSGQKGGGEGW